MTTGDPSSCFSQRFTPVTSVDANAIDDAFNQEFISRVCFRVSRSNSANLKLSVVVIDGG